MAAFGRIKRDDMVARLERGDPWAGLQYDACALMAQNRREKTFGISARQGVVISMANAGRLDFDQYFAGLGAGQLDVFRSEEHTSELQSLMRISYAVFCLKKKKIHTNNKTDRLVDLK